MAGNNSKEIGLVRQTFSGLLSCLPMITYYFISKSFTGKVKKENKPIELTSNI